MHDLRNFLREVDRTIDLSAVLTEGCIADKRAIFLLSAQIEDLEREYKKVYKSLETYRM